jgi:hypothetical protein
MEVCVDVEEGRERLWPKMEGRGGGEGALVSFDVPVTLVNRSNSPSLMGTEAGRRIGSTGDALYSRGANAEAVMNGVETSVVSANFVGEESVTCYRQCRGWKRLWERMPMRWRGGLVNCPSCLRGQRRSPRPGIKRLSIQRLSRPVRLAIRGSLNACQGL